MSFERRILKQNENQFKRSENSETLKSKTIMNFNEL